MNANKVPRFAFGLAPQACVAVDQSNAARSDRKSHNATDALTAPILGNAPDRRLSDAPRPRSEPSYLMGSNPPPRKHRHLGTEPSIHARIRSLVLQYLGTKHCTSEQIAAHCCMHRRTLHRRLRSEGTSFESIKDEVRREMALHYIQDAEMPLMHVAEKLGYAEAAVLSRSCYRWFSVTPQKLRRRLIRDI